MNMTVELDNITELMPMVSIKPESAQTFTFLLTSYNKNNKASTFQFYPKPIQMMDPEIAVGFIKAMMNLQPDHQNVYQFNFTGIYGVHSIKAINAIMNYINYLQIDCLTVVHIDNYIDDELLALLIESKCMFEISHQLTSNDLANIKNHQLLEKSIVKIFSKINKAKLPFVYCPIVTQDNVNEMSTMVKFAGDNGASGVSFVINDHEPCMEEHAMQRPDIKLYIYNLKKALRLASIYNIEILLHELKRYQTKGAYQSPQKLVLLPDGYIATTTIYKTSQDNGAQHAAIGRFTLEQGIQFFPERIQHMVDNVKKNVLRNCLGCESFIYCRGRNTNLRRFKERPEVTKDAYSCELTRNIYHLLASIT